MKCAGGDPGRAWQLLLRFFYAHRGQRPATSDAAALSPVQCHVLHLIEPGRPIPMSRLAEALACDASNVTGLIDRLESRGLIERRPSAEDRRIKVLDLTPAGVRMRTQLLNRPAQRSHPLSRLTADEQRTLIALLERLLDDDQPR